MFKTPGIGKRCSVIPAAVLATLALALTVQAQVAGPCAETISKFCGNVTPGEGRLLKCLNEHRGDQSIACQDWLDAQQKSLQEMNVACSEEIARLCSFDPPDGIRIFRCLQDNYVALRLDCRAKLREIKERAR
ncbi:MAG TPA: cysteine rich repeat-containing protein [Nitrospirota bacterium]|nr:cysteine rich repeat-containing protein [Nitrospirota bacterium]